MRGSQYWFLWKKETIVELTLNTHLSLASEYSDLVTCIWHHLREWKNYFITQGIPVLSIILI